VPAFAEKNFIGRSEPQKLSVVGCNGYATTRILQVREPMADRVNQDADETLYVVAGEATVRMGGADRTLEPGALAVIPRGTTHTLSRRGRNPVIFVSVLSGPPCQGLASK
jgi:mannose-6-phosphate isomerase-like protein (cupin superfamily)